MAKAAILMPYPELKDMAEALIPQYPRLTPMAVEYAQTAQAQQRARALVEKGCELIIARGLQARMIREAVLIPVIEMRASTQELESLVLELKKKVHPAEGQRLRLGIISFFNMLHNTERFNELFDIDLKVYTATSIDQYPQLVDRAYADGCLGLIGGQVAGRRAAELGLAFCFLSMGEESVREALEAASLVGYSIDLLKRSNAEMSTMLDNTFSAIMQVDGTGTVRRVNRALHQLLGREPDDVIGCPAVKVVPGLSQDDLDAVLVSGREIDTRVLALGRRTVLMNITPVLVEEQIDGAIFTFQEGQRISEMDTRLRQELTRQGHIAQHSFDQIFAADPEFKALLHQAKQLSRTPFPVLLSGESGTGKGILAQCMHNESLHRHAAFITVDCSIWHPDDLDEKLFGRFSRREGELSLAEQARGGTLYLRQVELLGMETQYKLLRLAKGQFLRNGLNQSVPTDVKLILSTEADLLALTRAGSFRRDLYYALSALRLDVPPLRSRRADIVSWFSAILDDWCGRIKRQIRLTREAEGFLAAYDWPGNLDQMSSLCQRLVLLSEKRTVDESALRAHLKAMEGGARAEPGALAQDPRAIELAAVLTRCHGSRERAAMELGISKTTLWRRMKKYGISRDLTIE